MSDDSNNSIDKLIKVANQLLKRFEEQKGIIHAYIQKERSWKEHKLMQANRIKNLEKEIKKINKLKKYSSILQI